MQQASLNCINSLLATSIPLFPVFAPTGNQVNQGPVATAEGEILLTGGNDAGVTEEGNQGITVEGTTVMTVEDQHGNLLGSNGNIYQISATSDGFGTD